MDSGGVLLRVAAVTHRGLTRPRNEDAFLLGGLVSQGPVLAFAIPVVSHHVLGGATEVCPGLVLAVADGLGGHAKGEVASRAGLDCLAEAWPAVRADSPQQAQAFWSETLEAAHQAVLRLAALHLDGSGMGATVAGVHLHADWGAVTFHAGDSRVYRFRQGILKPLTTDHSHAEVARRSGPIGSEQVRTTSAVWKCLGASGSRLGPSVELAAPALHPGDRYLLTTDGLTDTVGPDETESLLTAQPDAAGAVLALLDAALAAGGPDNVTIVLADVLSRPGVLPQPDVLL